MINRSLVKEIMRLLSEGYSQREIAASLNVSRQTINKIKTNKGYIRLSKKIKVYKAITLQRGKLFDTKQLSLLSGCSIEYVLALCKQLIKERYLIRIRQGRESFYKVVDLDQYYQFYLQYI